MLAADPREFLMYVGSGVVAVAVLTTIAFIFLLKQRDRVQYRMVLILVVFAIIAILMVFFGGNAEIKWDWGTATVAITGAAAAWIGALAFFAWKYPEEKLFPPPVPDQHTLDWFSKVLKEMERAIGWDYYPDWRDQRVAAYRDLFKSHTEGQTLKALLEAACNRHDKQRMMKAAVSTVFFYFDGGGEGKGYIIKFQRIEGELDKRAYVRYNSNASFPGSVADSVFLVGDMKNNKLTIARMFTDRDTVGHHLEGFEEVQGDRADCLIVTAYRDLPEKSDYLLVDVERFSHENRGELAIGIARPGREMNQCSAWMMRRPLAAPPRDVPLVFRAAGSATDARTSRIQERLDVWLDLLDTVIENHQGALPISDSRRLVDPRFSLVEMHKAITERARAQNLLKPDQPFKFADVFRFSKPKELTTFFIPNAHDVVVLLAQWN